MTLRIKHTVWVDERMNEVENTPKGSNMNFLIKQNAPRRGRNAIDAAEYGQKRRRDTIEEKLWKLELNLASAKAMMMNERH